MGWKNIKTHFDIKHIVHMRKGMVLIGSPYVSDLMHIDCEGRLHNSRLGSGSNEDLQRYELEISADPALVARLIAEPDSFSQSLPVYTYEGGSIIEKRCEEYGWPNVTHDGLLMYDNTFSPDKAAIAAVAKSNAEAGVEMGDRRLQELAEDIARVRVWRDQSAADLAKLNTDYPVAPTS